MRMVMLLALVLVANGAWAQTPASSTSEIYKFKGVMAKRVYAPDMPYNTQTHHQDGTFTLEKGQSKVLFDVVGNKGLQSAGTFTGGKGQISEYGNFIIRTSQIPDKQTHYRLKFHYDNNKTRHLDIYRHEEPEWGKVGDKNDGLVVISLQTAALFQSDAEVNSIHKIEIECLNYDNRGFKVEACYFITMMPNFDYSDIDGNDIGNAYIHPSFLIPSNGVNVYPYGEENGNPDYDNYIVEVEEATNYFVDNDPTKQIDWHRTPRNGDANIIDSLTYTNPKLVWSMNYKTPQNMNDVTYCTVDRWGDNASAGHFNGNALWRWIFVHRELSANNSSTGGRSEANLDLTNYKHWNSTADNSAEETVSCAFNFDNSDATLVFGNNNSTCQYVDLLSNDFKDYSKLLITVAEGDLEWYVTLQKNGSSEQHIAINGYHELGVSEGNGVYGFDLSKARNENYTKFRLHAVRGKEGGKLKAGGLRFVGEGVSTIYMNTGLFKLHSEYQQLNLNSDITATWAPAYGVVGVDEYNHQYVKLNDRTYLTIETTSNNPRFLFNWTTDKAVDVRYQDANQTYVTKNGNLYTVNLAQIKTDKGFVHLNSIKFADASDANKVRVSSIKVITEDLDQAANYTLRDKDAIHFYNSVYNGDFTNTPHGCHGDDHATREQINYIYYQTYGNEYNQIMCDAEHVPANRMPVKDGDKIIGYYANVTADGHLVPANEMQNIKLSIKDICLTKNKVQVQQNHVNVAKLYSSTTELPITAQETVLGDDTPNMNKKADLTGYSRLMIKGQPKTEVRLFFNADDNDHRVERKVKMDSNGYVEVDLTDPELVYNGSKTECHGGVYLSSIKGSAWGATALLDYVRAVKDQDLIANGVHELVREDFHTWNGGVNATVTRRDANGTDFKTTDGFFKYDDWAQNFMHNYAELTGWKWMKLVGDAGTNVFFTYNAESVTNNNVNVKTEYVTLDANGEAWVNIGDHQYFHLHNIGKNGEGAGSLTHVYLVPDPRVDYVLRGNGTLGLDAAKAMLDPTACVIDARTRVNNKQVIDLYTEQVYDANTEVWNIAKWIGLSDQTLVIEPTDATRARYIRMANQNCIVMVRGDFDSTEDEIEYGDIKNIQYWHGIRSMHHANMAIIPADYDGTTGHKVMTAGLFLVDGFPYRIPMQLRITQGNSGSYARVNNTAAGTRALVNTICVPFTVTLATKSGDTNSIHANASTDRNALNGEETRCQFYKITDLVHNTTRETTTAGLLQQDVVKQGDYVFWFEPVTTLEPYHPYVFVNKYDGQLREGTRMEVYTGWAGAHNDVYPTVNPDGTMCQNMNNASDKTDLNGDDKDDYYLRGTNAAKHIRDCWYFNTEGRLVKAKYMTNNTFRAVLKSDSRSINMPFENDPAAQIKVVHADWMNGADEEVVAVEAVDVTNDAMVSVYSVNGILLRPSVELGVALEGLPSGIYIVNGKKAIKK